MRFSSILLHCTAHSRDTTENTLQEGVKRATTTSFARSANLQVHASCNEEEELDVNTAIRKTRKTVKQSRYLG